MAARYIEALQEVQPGGPYYLGGWSLGGVVAWEIAQQLQALGEEVGLLAVIDSYAPTGLEEQIDDTVLTNSLVTDLGGIFGKELSISANELQQLLPEEQLNSILQKAKYLNILPPEISIEQMHRLFKVFKANLKAMYDYLPLPYSGPTVLFSASDEVSQRGWSSLATEAMEIYNIPGDHYGILQKPHVGVLAKQLETCLEKFNNRTYAKTLYIAHDNFDELHALSRAERNRLTIFIQKTNSSSSQITFILIEGYFN